MELRMEEMEKEAYMFGRLETVEGMTSVGSKIIKKILI
jgi:hypothetical protein